jgi:LmbE family N-acetylglucosaminyl deacetylase
MSKGKSSQDSILVICAHSDDQIFGPGGTIAKYAKEGKKVYTIIFSYGEMSHPWFQKMYTIKARVKESLDVDKFIGGTGVIFLGLEEGKFVEQYNTRKMYPKLKKLIEQYNPSRIFTHSLDDPLPDHRAVNKLVTGTLDRMKSKCEVFMFDIWNIINFKKQNYVSIVIDISDTFKYKISALKMFRSQGGARFLLTWSVYLKAIINGIKNNVKYAEVFYKIR